MKKTKIFVATLLIILATNGAVSAKPSSTNSEDPKVQVESMEMNMEKLDNQIEDVLNKIEQNKNKITTTQKDIKTTEVKLKESEKNIKNEQELFNKRIRAMYVNGSEGYLSVLLDSKGIGDFIGRVDVVTKVIDYDKKVIEKFKVKQKDINTKKQALISENNKLLALKSDNEKKLTNLNKNKEEQKKLIAEAKNKQKLYAMAKKSEAAAKSEAAVNSAAKQVADIRKEAPKVNPSRGGSASISSNNIIAYASNFLGTPYVWGGTSPNPGFDCSGFTQYVYAHFGVSIGRTTFDQINDGTQVSRDNLQPGDLVFFGTSSNPHHVGIYVGNDSYIHAPHTGDVIKISTLGRGDYLTARRVK